MNEYGQKLRNMLYHANPYDGFNAKNYETDLFGWGSTHPNFENMLKLVNPRLIVEVGTWQGGSAIHMAKLAISQGLDFHLLCVDTWLGGLEIWLTKSDPHFYDSLQIKHGHPNVYFQFLSNVLHEQLENYITPFPQTSLIAARWLAHNNISPDLVYIDASHDAQDVYNDMEAYWKILSPHGAIFGDDYHKWDGVRAAVKRFCDDYNLTFSVQERQWYILSEES